MERLLWHRSYERTPYIIFRPIKNKTIVATAAYIMLTAMSAITACSKSDSDQSAVDCSTLNAHIRRDETAYAAGPSPDKCLVVVGDYNEYINGNCPDEDEYVKDLNAFKAAYNNCQ